MKVVLIVLDFYLEVVVKYLVPSLGLGFALVLLIIYAKLVLIIFSSCGLIICLMEWMRLGGFYFVQLIIQFCYFIYKEALQQLFTHITLRLHGK